MSVERERSERVIESRFRGPEGVGNGGIVCAILAEPCGPSLEVVLRRPAPLDRALALRPRETGAGYALLDGAELVAEAWPAELALDVPAAPSFDEASDALRRALGAPHPFPGCFVCGPARAEGDGLRVITAPWPGRPGVAVAPWRPHASFADASGRVEARFVWAALDCPGGLAALGGESRPIVLARFRGRIERTIAAGERCVVIGWTISALGRKHSVGTALLDAAGRVCGRALATWVELDPARHAAA